MTEKYDNYSDTSHTEQPRGLAQGWPSSKGRSFQVPYECNAIGRAMTCAQESYGTTRSTSRPHRSSRGPAIVPVASTLPVARCSACEIV